MAISSSCNAWSKPGAGSRVVVAVPEADSEVAALGEDEADSGASALGEDDAVAD
jgi:hypothetical protein